MSRIFLERRDSDDDARQLIEWVGGDQPQNGVNAECVPPVDVIETTSAIEIRIDLPGVKHDSIQIVFAQGTVVIAGLKQAAACEHTEAAFHLAERAFGRFARAVRLSGAIDAGRARATLSCGELRIVLPRIEDRRGHEIRIPVTAA